MKPTWILIAEDDEHDADLLQRVLATDPGPLASDAVVTRDGSELLDCLYRRRHFQGREDTPPAFVMLDLKMPTVDGLEVLRQMKSDARLKMIPVIVFSSSRDEADLRHSYQLGANAYVVKPVAFKEFAATVRAIRDFWVTLNEPPPRPRLPGDETISLFHPATLGTASHS